ncbi:hypothetical protein NC651_036952 [Populus alba x Populus x berolinensis]|nr:hypothetical protein NC651_036952 [Populus alba x Populus x berolinensis]
MTKSQPELYRRALTQELSRHDAVILRGTHIGKSFPSIQSRILHLNSSIVLGQYFSLHFEGFQLGMTPVYMTSLCFINDRN